MPSRILDYPIFDADNHMYEATDAFTKYLPKEYEGVIKYVEVNGRTKIAVKNKISDYIPNPTFNKVASPGAQELEFKLKNPDSMTAADKELQLAPPPRYIEAPDAFFEPEARIVMMDDQGIDRAIPAPARIQVGSFARPSWASQSNQTCVPRIGSVTTASPATAIAPIAAARQFRRRR